MKQIKRTRPTTWLWNAVWAVGLLLVCLTTAPESGAPAEAGPVTSAAWPPPVPSPLNLSVRETAGVARVAEVTRSGVPLPRSLNILNTTLLTVVDAANQRRVSPRHRRFCGRKPCAPCSVGADPKR